jgi:hypothetical protein
MTPNASRRLTVALLGSLLLVATACGSDHKSTAAAASVAPATTTATTAVATTVAPQAADTTPAPAPTAAATVPTAAADTEAATDPPAQAGGKVNINEASISELEAAYKAAGVSNPRRWAQETDEYRPYPTDPGFAKLRQELGKYNIDPAVLELIISTLEF